MEETASSERFFFVDIRYDQFVVVVPQNHDTRNCI